jgi:hypothetical protein
MSTAEDRQACSLSDLRVGQFPRPGRGPSGPLRSPAGRQTTCPCPRSTLSPIPRGSPRNRPRRTPTMRAAPADPIDEPSPSGSGPLASLVAGAARVRGACFPFSTRRLRAAWRSLLVGCARGVARSVCARHGDVSLRTVGDSIAKRSAERGEGPRVGRRPEQPAAEQGQRRGSGQRGPQARAATPPRVDGLVRAQRRLEPQGVVVWRLVS